MIVLESVNLVVSYCTTNWAISVALLFKIANLLLSHYISSALKNIFPKLIKKSATFQFVKLEDKKLENYEKHEI